MIGLLKLVASIQFRSKRNFDFSATLFVGGGKGNGNGVSLSDGFGILMGVEVIAGVIAGATGIVYTGCFEELQ